MTKKINFYFYVYEVFFIFLFLVVLVEFAGEVEYFYSSHRRILFVSRNEKRGFFDAAEKTTPLRNAATFSSCETKQSNPTQKIKEKKADRKRKLCSLMLWTATA